VLGQQGEVVCCPQRQERVVAERASMLPQLGLAAGAAAWKAGHAAVRSGALVLADLDDAARDERLAAYAAEQARAYVRQVEAQQQITPAQGGQLLLVYMRTVPHGAPDQEPGGGALLQPGRGV